MVFIGPSLPPGPQQRPQHQAQEQHGDRLNGYGKAISSSGVQLSAAWHRPQAAACGLNNLGNSCYLNSVLQCLAHLPPLGNVCLARLHSAHGCRLPSGTCTCCLVETQVARMLSSSSLAQRSPDSPYGIHRNLGALGKGFVKGRQEDAHELLRCLVDAMERDLLKNEGRYDPHKPVKNPNTLVNVLFSGILQSQVHCLSCGHESNTYDPMMDLSLELQAGCRSVEDALSRFTAVERLDGANKYRCDGCKQLVPAEKRMAIYDDPNILVVHLKRFDGAFGKITREIAFDETLDLEPYMAATSATAATSAAGKQQGQQQRRKRPGGRFVLHGVLIHEGLSANSGHYYAYVKDGQPSPTCKWHCMNDSSVYRVSEAKVQESQRGAYILFYVRTSMKEPAPVPEHTEHDAPRSATAAASSACGPQPGPLKRAASGASSASGDGESPRKRSRIGAMAAPAAAAAAAAAAVAAGPGAAAHVPIGPQPPPGAAASNGAAAPAAAWSSGAGRLPVPGVTRIGFPLKQGSTLASRIKVVAAAPKPAQQQQQQQEEQEEQAAAGAVGQPPGTGGIAPAHSHPAANGSSHVANGSFHVANGTGHGSASGHAANGHAANAANSQANGAGDGASTPRHAHGVGRTPGGHDAAVGSSANRDSSSNPSSSSANGHSSSNLSSSSSCSWEALKAQLVQGLHGSAFLQAMRRIVGQAAARGLNQDQVLASKELRAECAGAARMPVEILTLGKDGVYQHLLAHDRAASAAQ